MSLRRWTWRTGADRRQPDRSTAGISARIAGQQINVFASAPSSSRCPCKSATRAWEPVRHDSLRSGTAQGHRPATGSIGGDRDDVVAAASLSKDHADRIISKLGVQDRTDAAETDAVAGWNRLSSTPPCLLSSKPTPLDQANAARTLNPEREPSAKSK